ncbi:Eukaryotic translation initiation factor 3 subunit A [Halotydeus destructor]|nr:Eukaryotic translation initiation factor 3 subunit A [Halotydeus destructor]
MPQHFHRIENALKRANEFIDVDKKLEALEILCDVLRSRKHRIWQKTHHDIMVKYLELCVELRKSYVAKEGIYQYKIICQQTQIKSFEDIVRIYLQLAEEKAEAAKNEAQAATLDVDDLDNAQTPENILLSAVSSEDTQDRTDRVVLLPWVKFLWESYRQCLDLLKNNARTEKLYHDIAHKAFQFCIKFNRKTEFRKLCDNLHAHLDILKKQQQQLLQTPPSAHTLQNIINLTNPESQAFHLETRLLQLDCAITMELWQEAYKATDDIRKFNLMNLSKKPLKPQLMASYYHKLALVFLKANCPLFHAAALFKHFTLTREMKKTIKEDELQKMASKVVASILSMPIPPTRPEIDKLVDTEENVVENHQRNLASLLGLNTAIPSRASLIADLRKTGVLSFAYDELQQLYNILEVEFHPLQLCKKVEVIIKFMDESEACPDLKLYTSSLKDVAIVRLLKEIAQVYQSIEYSRLLELCPFVDPIYLEKMIVDAARRNDLQVRINHRTKSLLFGTESAFKSEEVIEGPHLQSMPSSQMRQQLVTMYSTLQKARSLIDSDRTRAQREDLRRTIMVAYERVKHNEHAQILERQNYIEARKEELEQIGQQREEDERKALNDKNKLIRKQEEERMKRESDERAARDKAKKEQDVRRQMVRDTIDQMKKTEVGAKLFETLGEEDLEDMKVDEIKIKQFEQLEKERRELIAKQDKIQRKMDHLERAKRLEEIPLLQAQYEQEKIRDRELFEQAEVERVKTIVAERELALTHRDRLLRMRDEATKFANKIKEARSAEYEQRLAKWQDMIAIEKANRMQKRRNDRKEKRRREYESEKKRKDQERAEKEKRERMEELKRIRDKENAEMDAMSAKQKEREMEIERKQREKDEALYQNRGGDREAAQEEPRWRGGGPKKVEEAEPEGPWRKGGGRDIPAKAAAADFDRPSAGAWRPKRDEAAPRHDERPPYDDQSSRDNRPPRDERDRREPVRDGGNRYEERPRGGGRFEDGRNDGPGNWRGGEKKQPVAERSNREEGPRGYSRPERGPWDREGDQDGPRDRPRRDFGNDGRSGNRPTGGRFADDRDAPRDGKGYNDGPRGGGPPRRDDQADNPRGGRFDDERGPRRNDYEDRGGPRRNDTDDRGGPRRNDDNGDWRREKPRGDREPPQREGAYKGPSREGPSRGPRDDRRQQDPESHDDGWTTVKSK